LLPPRTSNYVTLISTPRSCMRPSLKMFTSANHSGSQTARVRFATSNDVCTASSNPPANST
jgi:hypothetical protein